MTSIGTLTVLLHMHKNLRHSEQLLIVTGQDRVLMGCGPTMLHLVMQVIQVFMTRDKTFRSMARNLMMPSFMLLRIQLADSSGIIRFDSRSKCTPQ